jgi:hypothetical protein
MDEAQHSLREILGFCHGSLQGLSWNAQCPASAPTRERAAGKQNDCDTDKAFLSDDAGFAANSSRVLGYDRANSCRRKMGMLIILLCRLS